MELHTWYISQELVALAIFDSRVAWESTIIKVLSVVNDRAERGVAWLVQEFNGKLTHEEDDQIGRASCRERV